MTNILIGVTGGIACYKSVILCRLFIKAGCKVKVILTDNAAKFVTPLTFEAVTGSRVYTDEFSPGNDPDIIEHIELAEWADEFILAPASANTIAKMAGGIADNLLTSTLLVYQKPVIIAPAMNTNMYENPLTQENMTKLSRLGHRIIEPDSGGLACRVEGKGRMKEPEDIFEEVYAKDRFLEGRKVLVTAGPTREYLDPVRYITNRSSGKMGYAVAEEAKKCGADVVLVSGPVNIQAGSGIKRIDVETAGEMFDAVMAELDNADIVIMSAAVADYAPEMYNEQKIKKNDEDIEIKLKKNPDILKNAGEKKKDKQVLIGFAAESEELEKNAVKKLKAKNLDFIVANDISRKDIGFDTEDNEASIFFADGSRLESGKLTKKELACLIIEKSAELL